MTAKLYILPSGPRRATGQRNLRYGMAQRHVILSRPEVQEQLAECERLLTAHHASRLLTNTVETPRHAKPRQLD